MEHKITYRTPDGMLQETLFDNFDEFADRIEGVAHEYYQGVKPAIDVETIYNNGLIKKERVTDDVQSPRNGSEFLKESD